MTNFEKLHRTFIFLFLCCNLNKLSLDWNNSNRTWYHILGALWQFVSSLFSRWRTVRWQMKSWCKGREVPRFPGAGDLFYDGRSKKSSLRKHHLDWEGKNMETSKQSVGVVLVLGEEGAFQASLRKVLRKFSVQLEKWVHSGWRMLRIRQSSLGWGRREKKGHEHTFGK